MQAYEDLKRALEEAGIERTLEPLWPQAPYQTRCTACHLGAEAITKELFRHETHVARRGLECATCHQDKSFREPQHGAQKLGCTDCHPTQAQLAIAEPQDCLQCHQAQIPTRSQLVKFPHDTHINFGFNCAICHENVNQLDHLEFLKFEKAVPKLGHDFCAACHKSDVPPEGSNCTKCHIRF